MFDFIKTAFKNLGRKRIRSILTIVGIAIGVASVIMISNISQCGTTAITTELESLGLGGLMISPSPDVSGATLEQSDLSVIKSCSGVEEATPVVVQTTDVSAVNVESKALIWGIDHTADRIISLNVLYGRLFNQKDISSNANVCLVDENFSNSAYHRSNIIGKTISIVCGGVEEDFTVIGIVKTGSGLLQNMLGDYIPTFIYVPYTTVQASSGSSHFDQVAVKVKDNSDVDQAGETIISSLDRQKGLENGFVSNDLAKQREGLTTMLDIVTLILSAVGAISLLVASLSIMTVMLVSVSERTREIGIKKAIGAKQSAILFEFLLEAIMLSIIGCLIGIITGYLISYAGTAYFNISLDIRWDIMLLAVGFALFTGTIFGVYPAYKASRLKPVDALRFE